MSGTSDELLKEFFSAYFHEDWRLDAETPEEVVDEFARAAAPHDVQALSAAIRDLSVEFESDNELEKRLFAQFGCYYRPSADALSTRLWLVHLAELLLKTSPD